MPYWLAFRLPEQLTHPLGNDDAAKADHADEEHEDSRVHQDDQIPEVHDFPLFVCGSLSGPGQSWPSKPTANVLGLPSHLGPFLSAMVPASLRFPGELAAHRLTLSRCVVPSGLDCQRFGSEGLSLLGWLCWPFARRRRC